MNKAILIFGMLFSLSALGSEQYDGIPDKFMELVAKGESEAALDSFFGKPKDPKKVTAESIYAKEKSVKILNQFGKYYFHEKISEEKIGSRYALLTYIIGYDEKPLFISISLYKKENSWAVKSYKTNSNYKELVKDVNEGT